MGSDWHFSELSCLLFTTTLKRCSSYLIHEETQVQRGWGCMGDWFRSPCMLLLHHCMSLLPSELRILRLPVLRRTVGMSVSFSSDFSILPLLMSVHNRACCCCAKKKKAKIQVFKRQAWVCVCVGGVWICTESQDWPSFPRPLCVHENRALLNVKSFQLHHDEAKE